jgi:hypothetical protein
MGYSLRDVAAARKFSSALTVEALHRVIPPATIEAVLDATGARERRERKLTMAVVVWLLIAMNLYTHLALDRVLGKLARGLRYIWPDPEIALPTASAISYRRAQLGAGPLVALFRRVCRPLATPATPGAFLFGLRLPGLDGTVEDVPDTAANAAYWGHHPAARGPSAFPQVQAVYLVECGTHAIVDAGFWPGRTSERVGGRRLLRAVGPGMLVLWDCGFHEYDLVAGAHGRGAQVLGRLPAGARPEVLRTLADGSVLPYLRPSDPPRRRAGEQLLVRLVRYTVTDPQLAGYGEEHRLVTTLLDPAAAPALALARAYHERWECELVIDEVDTHQRPAGRVLRSQSPVGVVQELYGLLLAHYAIRALMHEAAGRVAVAPDRLSFTRALELLRDAIPEFQMTRPAQLPLLLARLLRDMAARLLPPRRPRANPRVVKRKMSKFKLKRPELRPSRKLAQPFHLALALI